MLLRGLLSAEQGQGERRGVANLKAQGLGLFFRSPRGRLHCLWNFTLDFGLSLLPACASDAESYISAPGILVSDFIAAADAPGCGLSESPSNFDTSILGRELGSESRWGCWGRRGDRVLLRGLLSAEPGREARRQGVNLKAQGLGLFFRRPRRGLDCFWNFHLDCGLSLLPALASDAESYISALGILVSDFIAGADAPGCGLSESPSNFDTSILDRELGSIWCRGSGAAGAWACRRRESHLPNQAKKRDEKGRI